jgi:mRNA interferase RelE/StbE
MGNQDNNTLVIDEMTMNIIVISQRDDNYCYELVAKLYQKYGDAVFENKFEAL